MEIIFRNKTYTVTTIDFIDTSIEGLFDIKFTAIDPQLKEVTFTVTDMTTILKNMGGNYELRIVRPQPQ